MKIPFEIKLANGDLVTLRRAEKSDVPHIVHLSVEGRPDGKPKKIIPNPLPDGYISAFERIQANSNCVLIVAEIDHSIIGTFQITFLTFIAGAGHDDCQIESVYVDAKWRNKGIGTAMMQWVIEFAKTRRCRRIQLTTNKLRKNAHRFYQSLGFELSHEGAKMMLPM